MYFVGNMRRREDIRRFWYFDCQCPRCSDPTELGSYMSAVICFACKLGFLVPTDSLQYKSDWKCDSCGNLQSYDLVNEVISTIESQVSTGSLDMYEIDLCIFCKTNSYFSFYSFLGIAVLPATAVLQWVSIRLGGVQKLRLQEEVVGSPELSSFCQYLLAKNVIAVGRWSKKAKNLST